ncbi:phospholipid-translocating P-type ATPase [Hesseltinella vesiculosa]|uniref:Phospholipid-transporting ATPase n=1 Tax=Hesseltinella vesiculosa TaxID=101127 RepID=A0A1X2GA84_9FUNG|nr:phospholipid-translocating P-type ATPase [Hesseltinella vesiculosa]
MPALPKSLNRLQRRPRDNDSPPSEYDLQRTTSTSSYMQQRRNVYVNMDLPASEYDSQGRPINRHYVSNRIRTAKYTPLTFVPKNLFEQFRNVANLFFLFVVILQCVPLFGVTEPAVSALPLIAILVITAIKDAIEDWKRNQSDQRFNHAKTRVLHNWRNVNTPIETHGSWHFVHLVFGFFSTLAGAENKYAHGYRMHVLAKKNNANRKSRRPSTASALTPVSTLPAVPAGDTLSPLQNSQPQRSSTILKTMRHRSDTLRSELSSIFRKREPYRPGVIPHSVLYRTATNDTSAPHNHTQTSLSAHHDNDEDQFLFGGRRPSTHPGTACSVNPTSCDTRWKTIQWQDLHVGDYVQIRNDEPAPADIVILATSELDSICYIETQNLDGETNLKVRQGLPGTADMQTVHDCEQASFYIESEPPHVNLYQFNGVLRWTIDPKDNGTLRSGVSHEKADAINYNNILLRGSVLRNTEWIIGIVVYTGNDTKIMLNTGQTPSKRSKMAKKTNPHVVANFVILAIICIISSVMDSAQFNASGSSRHFDFGIEGSSQAYSGFITFWVTLILYQNIVPISLYISVEIVKTLAAYFIYADIDMYHEETDSYCIPKTWNISDDLGQIEYVFSDKTGTLTQNVMEYKKCTINGVSYGLGKTEAQMGAAKRAAKSLHDGESDCHAPDHEKPLDLEAVDHETGMAVHSTTDLDPTNGHMYENDDDTTKHGSSQHVDDDGKPSPSLDHDHGQGLHDSDDDADDELAGPRKEMLAKQAALFNNRFLSDMPTFVDPRLFEDLAKKDPHANALQHFFVSLALCHSVIAERPDPDQPDKIEYRSQSPDEAALVDTARDLGFVFLGKEGNTAHAEIMGERKAFDILNVLEFNSTRKRMSVIIKPHDSDRIVLLCKGADSVIYERLCDDFGTQHDLEQSQQRLRDDTLKHLELYANEGLRTLCLSYRFISMDEYMPWQRRYQEAASSIINREERVDAACEEIELNMLLMGGTAIEDRLQDGVPDTIAELAKSGIKLWVLTGDKTETAINIGFACNLLTTEMELVVLKASTREEAQDQLAAALEKTKDAPLAHADDNANANATDFALVIDGTTLKYALEPSLKNKLLALGMRCKSVICCRVSPKQKAQVVAMVKKGLKVMTLAIGDGANDVSMIQEANIGVGISGLEGRQAVMASDYAIAQFRFLRKLLLVHGRWSYLRTAEMIMGFFFKNIVWTFVLFWYQIFCQFNGTMMFDYALVTLYNLVFTSLPIIFLGIWDQDLSCRITLKYPELYRMGLRNDKFRTWRFWLTCFDAIFQSSVCFFFPYMLLIGGSSDPSGLDGNGVYEIGTIISGITVVVANVFVVFSLYSYTWLQLLIISLSILVYYAFIAVYSQFNTFLFAGQIRLFGNGNYWLVLILTVAAAFVPRVAAKYYLHQYYPYDNDIIRERELVLHRSRSNHADGPDYTTDIKLEERRPSTKHL